MLQKFYLNKEKILKKSQEFFSNSNLLTPKIGCELEFFLLEKNSLTPAGQGLVDDFIFELQKKYRAKKEQGAAQIEIETDFTADLSELCRELENCKNFVKKLANEKNLIASFAAQPFFDDCGNALQFNVSLHDKTDKNIFKSDEKILRNSAAALLQMTDEMMIFLAPKEEDYARFSLDLNRELFRQGKFTAPVNLSFGADNRTCAIRIPNQEVGKRLEYRLAAADADPWLCMAAILIALSLEKKSNFEQIFGNAFDEQYQLKNFCQNLSEAQKIFFEEGKFIRKKLEEFCGG